MTVILDGRSLTRDALVRAAREGLTVALDPAAATAMAESHTVVLAAAAAGRPVYGVTTAVGVLKRVAVTEPDAAAYSKRMIRHHLVGQGGTAPADVVRAAMLRLAHAFARRTNRVRPGL